MGSATQPTSYDEIGRGYARTRLEDARFREHIHAALGDARTVVNIGAGTGSYEPRGRHVIALEPSDVMAGQRPSDLAPAIRGTARELPLRDDSVDAAMAVLTVHHWDHEQERGVREMRRVARDAVVIVTYDPADQRSDVADGRVPPRGRRARPADLPVPGCDRRLAGRRHEGRVHADSRDTPDWMLGSFWAHPERVLDRHARAATSGFARMRPAIVDRVVTALERDLQSGAWDRRHGDLRELAEYDVGLRLIINTPHRCRRPRPAPGQPVGTLSRNPSTVCSRPSPSVTATSKPAMGASSPAGPSSQVKRP